MITVNDFSKKKKILLLDFAGEKNRGDAAMQVSVIDLVRKNFPDAKLDIITIFGSNQYPEYLDLYDHTYKKYPDIEFNSAILNTYEKISGTQKDINRNFDRVLRLLSIAKSSFVIFLLKLKLIKVFGRLIFNQETSKTFRAIKESDIVIWNGRNFRGHSYFGEILHVYSICFHAILCVILKKQIFCVGASVWELKSAVSRHLIVWTFSRCEMVTLREVSSYEYVQKLFANKKRKPILKQVPDLSLYMLSKIPKVERTTNQVSSIAMTIVGRREIGEEKYDLYISNMQQLVTYIIDELQANITVVPQVTFAAEVNDDALEKIFNGIQKEKYTVLENEHTVEELVAEYKKHEFLVASRMHSAIFALTQGVPVLAIAYDEGAKWNILTDMGFPESSLLNVSELVEKNLVNEFKKAWGHKNATILQINKQLQEVLYPKVEDQFMQIKEIYLKNENKK